MGFSFIILEYPFIFLNWWKKINKHKYTFLFLDAGVELAWGKLENWRSHDSVEKPNHLKFIVSVFMRYASILFHYKLEGIFHWDPRSKLETRRWNRDSERLLRSCDIYIG